MDIAFQPQQKKKFRLLFLLCLSALFFVLCWFLWAVFVPVSAGSGHDPEIIIRTGSGSIDIANQLEQEGAIRSSWAFVLYTTITGKKIDLQAGRYIIESQNIPQIVQKIVAGEVVTDDVTVTIIEGWNVNQVVEELEKYELVDKDFINLLGSPDYLLPEVLKAGRPDGAAVEGYLFPDTYRFAAQDSGEDVAKKMFTNFASKITPELQQQISASPLTLYEIITLASIVEKEVSSTEDRRIVADIFLRRIDDEYLLQSDATVNYVTGKDTPRASASDINVDNPYNTYEYPGLPPGPIANPSLDAIQSVVNPEPNEYYFFLTTPEGKTIFSKTFDEHVQNKNRYYP